MAYYLFCSTRDDDVMAVTVNPTGANLPDDWKPWSPVNNGSLLSAKIGFSDEMAAELAKTGFFLVHSNPKTKAN